MAEPKPDALPARCGTAFHFAFDAGQIIPEPKVIISIGKRSLKGERKGERELKRIKVPKEARNCL